MAVQGMVQPARALGFDWGAASAMPSLAAKLPGSGGSTQSDIPISITGFSGLQEGPSLTDLSGFDLASDLGPSNSDGSFISKELLIGGAFLLLATSSILMFAGNQCTDCHHGTRTTTTRTVVRVAAKSTPNA
jgi:hypothetical protein